MKIMHIIKSSHIGGAEMMLCKLSKILVVDQADSKFELAIVLLQKNSWLEKEMTSLGVKTYNLYINKINFLYKFIQLLLIIRSFQPNIIQTWMYFSDIYGGVAAKLLGVEKIIWSIRSAHLYSEKVSSTKRMLARICGLISYLVPSHIVCNSRTGLYIHQRLWFNNKKMSVIDNGFDLEKFHPDKQAKSYICKELGLSENTNLIGYFARYDYLKDHVGFIKAAEIVIKYNIDVHFLLAGKDIDYNNKVLTGLIKQLNLENNIHLLGVREDMSKLTASLDIAVSFSISEAFSNCIGEAMACGIPCIVTDVGDSARIVDDKDLVVPVGDYKNLAKKCINFLYNDQEKISFLKNKMHIRAVKYFSIEKITNDYKELYLSSL